MLGKIGRAAALAIGVAAALGWFASASAQPIPVSYLVRLESATSYDTRARDEDTVYAALAVFVNGERKGAAVWDGKGWDGSRPEGRRWVTGLHLFGPSSGSTVQVAARTSPRTVENGRCSHLMPSLPAGIECDPGMMSRGTPASGRRSPRRGTRARRPASGPSRRS